MAKQKHNLQSAEGVELLRKFVEGEVSVSEFSKELGITRTALYDILTDKIHPNPFKLREKNLEAIYKKVGRELSNGKSYEEVLAMYPSQLLNVQKMFRLVRQGKIKVDNKKKSKDIMEDYKQMIVEKVQEGATREEILAPRGLDMKAFLEKHNLIRSSFYSMVRNYYGGNTKEAKNKILDELGVN